MSAASANAPRWRIASIRIAHFRGVAKEQTFSFDGRSGLLHGRNGHGKSTVALALQWILYGKFPDGVLANVKLDSFLAPVGVKGKAAYAGEVVFARGGEKLVVSRDGKQLTVALDAERWSGEEAEARRDALLGTEVDTFSRTVLLHQSRVRGLLMDEVAERNRCLDRLIGMDDVERLLAVVKSKPFSDAAKECRAALKAEQQKLVERERLLGEQLEEAQQRARELKFLNKDLNPTGLRTRYAEVGVELAALAKRHGVTVQELPACEKPADVAKVGSAFRAGVQAIRVGSELKVRLTPVETSIATLTSLQQRWTQQLQVVERAKAALAAGVEKHGDRNKLVSLRGDEQAALDRARAALKSANELRELLSDTLTYTRRGKPAACPSCEQPIPAGLDLHARLEQRIAALASEDILKLEQSRGAAEKRVLELEAALKTLGALEAAEQDAQKVLDLLRQKVADALGGGSGVAENKVAGRLQEALNERAVERAKLAEGVAALEKEVGALELRERTISGALADAVKKRAELEKHEETAKARKAAFAKDELRATGLEQRAAQLEAIKKALLEAKQELAGETLAQARPRAQELYARLVRHPVFDTLDIHATPRAGKVDYTFEVSTGGESATARDARLVLSDGQLTAAALALFFGLAETCSHDLDVLYVDDPTQNLDLPSKEAMAKVVAELSERRQVIVSTQDEDFVTALESGDFKERGVVHRITAWDGNPTVKTDVPA